MQVIYEVRKEQNTTEKLFPISTAANGAAAKKKAEELNSQLAKNKTIKEGLLTKVRLRLNGNSNFLEAKELAQFEALDDILEIVEYRAEFINDKRITRYNPQEDVTKIKPTKEQIERSEKARKEGGFINPEEEKKSKPKDAPKPSKTALAILKEAEIDWKDLEGSGKDGKVTVEDAEKAATEKATAPPPKEEDTEENEQDSKEVKDEETED